MGGKFEQGVKLVAEPGNALKDLSKGDKTAADEERDMADAGRVQDRQRESSVTRDL